MNNSQQIGNIKSFNTLMGGLATNTSSLLMGGNATFNILNLTDFGSRINGGLLELTVGKDGVSSKIGNGGTNISYSTIKSSISGASSLHKNSQINNTKYDKQTKDALRSQWGFGDKTAKKQLEEIIKGDTILKLDADGSEVAQSINENGQKIIHINSSQNEGFIDLGLTLQHEAHRDGIISDEQSQYIETVNAVAGHTQMALAMAIDKLYTKDMLNHISSDSNLQNDINAYMYAAYTGNTSLFAGYVGANYDTSADYWKLEQREDGSFGWAWDGDFDFNINGIGKISAEKMKAYSNTYEAILDGETVITDGSITSEKMALNTIAVLFNEAGNNSFMQFISETEGFADASIAAKQLKDAINAGNPREINQYITQMNTALYAAQNSGLLVKNDPLTIETTNLIGTGTTSSPYFPLAGYGTENPYVKITSYQGWRLVDSEMAAIPSGNYVLNEFSPYYHQGWDGVGSGNIVASLNGGLYLDYLNAEGFQVNNTTELGTFNTSHASANTIDQYFSLLGQSGINMNYNNGTYLLTGLQAGTVIGYMGNTGANTTGAHAHMSLNASGVQFASVFNQDYSFSLGYNSFFPDSYAANMSGYQNTIYFDNTELFNKVENYAKDNPLLFNYNDFYQQHYFEKFYSRYPEVR